MPLSLYLGNPGAGKSYGALKFGILEQLKRRRRVVTNISGLKLDKISDYLGFNIDGLLVCVSEEAVTQPGFWYSPAQPNAVTQPGDFIVIDEAWRYFKTGIKIPDACFEFFRKHRHYVHEATKISCDVWVLTQSFNDIQRSVKDIADFSISMTKLKVVGKPDTYRVDFFEGSHNISRRAPFKQEFHKYEPALFDLYESYTGGQGVEVQTDDRTDYWSSKVFFGLLTRRQAFRSVIVAVVFLFLTLFYVSYRILSRPPVPALASKPVSSSPVATAAVPGTPGAVPAPAPVPDDLKKDESPEFRLVGLYRFNDMPVAVVADRAGTLRYLTATEFSLVSAGPVRFIRYRERVIASWTGVPGPSLLPTLKTESK